MLTALQLRQFKSFRDQEFPLGRFTLLVGTNASGKTNVRDALRYLHGVGLGFTMPEVLGGRYGDGGVQQWTGIRGGPPEIGFQGSPWFSLAVRLETGSRAFEYLSEADLRDERLGPRVGRETLLDRGSGSVLYNANHGGVVDGIGGHTLIVNLGSGPYTAPGHLNPEYPEFESGLPALSIDWDEEGIPALEQACEAVRGVLRSIRFLDLDPGAMRRSSPPGQNRLGDRGENLSSVLKSIWQDERRRSQLLGWIRGLTPMDVVDLDFKTDLQGQILVYFREANGQETSAVSASDGTLRFLALAAALLSSDSGRVYFFEELDNGIHPTRLHLLLDLIETACANGDVQVIATTHNPSLLVHLGEQALQDALLVYRTEGEAQSRVRRIGDLPDIRRILKNQDLGTLHATGWLEDAAFFDDPEPDEKSA